MQLKVFRGGNLREYESFDLSGLTARNMGMMPVVSIFHHQIGEKSFVQIGVYGSAVCYVAAEDFRMVALETGT